MLWENTSRGNSTPRGDRAQPGGGLGWGPRKPGFLTHEPGHLEPPASSPPAKHPSQTWGLTSPAPPSHVELTASPDVGPRPGQSGRESGFQKPCQACEDTEGLLPQGALSSQECKPRAAGSRLSPPVQPCLKEARSLPLCFGLPEPANPPFCQRLFRVSMQAKLLQP